MSCPHPSKVRACAFHVATDDVNANHFPGLPKGCRFGWGRAIRSPSDSRQGVALALKVVQRGLQKYRAPGGCTSPPLVVSRYGGEMCGHEGGLEAILRWDVIISRWGFQGGGPRPHQEPPAREETTAVEAQGEALVGFLTGDWRGGDVQTLH